MVVLDTGSCTAVAIVLAGHAAGLVGGLDGDGLGRVGGRARRSCRRRGVAGGRRGHLHGIGAGVEDEASRHHDGNWRLVGRFGAAWMNWVQCFAQGPAMEGGRRARSEK